ncbi:MAG TPA: phosphodiester glycosidase family protein [Ferruginibacter sp.]|nr:phosphodiester glycosidase family protein [Ferruginibacter sp.]
MLRYEASLKAIIKRIFVAGIVPAICFFMPAVSFAQVNWINVDNDYAPLPLTVQVFKTTDALDGKPFIAFYVKAKLDDRNLKFTVDTTLGRRLTPSQFYTKNNDPLLVVNTTFFSFETNKSLNAVIRDGKLIGYNIHSIPMRGKDTFQYRHPLGSAIGISKRRTADIAWLYTDSSEKYPYATQTVRQAVKDSSDHFLVDKKKDQFKKWKMKTGVGGGPVLIQDGRIQISNNEELKFAGKAISDMHPRTCMGYTRDGYLIIMVIQGRFPGVAEGATLLQEAKLLQELGCVEALNLDGGGSSSMLINGKETITPSGKDGGRGEQRPVPAVFIIEKK